MKKGSVQNGLLMRRPPAKILGPLINFKSGQRKGTIVSLISAVTLLCSTSVFAYPSLQDRFMVPEYHQKKVVEQFDVYLDPLSDFDKRIAASMAYLNIEKWMNQYLTTPSSSDLAFQLHVVELAWALVVLTMERVEWMEPVRVIDQFVFAESFSGSDEAFDAAYIEQTNAFLQPLRSEYESEASEATGIAERIGALMGETYKAYAIENGYANESSKQADLELAKVIASRMQEVAAESLPQRNSERLVTQRVARAGEDVVFIVQLGYLADELAQAWGEGGSGNYMQMRFKFLEEKRKGICSDRKIRKNLLRWGGSIAYKYVFSDGAVFLTHKISACP